MRKMLFLVFLLISSCIPPVAAPLTQTPLPTQEGSLLSYQTRTVTHTYTPRPPSTSTLLPSSTPTPLTYVVKKGDDMFGISLRYGVSLDALMAANPKVTPRLLSVGTVLVIPAGGALLSATRPPPSSTPAPVQIGKLNCEPDRSGGAWCFALVTNPLTTALEGVSAVIRIGNEKTGEVKSLPANLPLNLLPPGKELPLAVYYPAPFPQPYQYSIELLSALPLPAADTRYLLVKIQNEKVVLSEDGLSAEVGAEIILDKPGAAVKQVAVALVLYDSDGDVIGMRRWDSGSISSGVKLVFKINVYSTGKKIIKVDMIPEVISATKP